MRNQIVILAGGKGTRMGGTVPKVLVMLKDKPVILYLLEEIQKINQLVKPVIVSGYMSEKVRGVLGEDYLYALQKEQLGTAHALLSAKEKITGENILVLLGDMPFIKAESLKSLVRLHQETNAVFSMLTSTVPNFEGEYQSLAQFGRIKHDAVGNIITSIEVRDASEDELKITEINPSIYMFNTKWLWENLVKVKNDNAQKEYYLTDLVQIAASQGQQIQNASINPKEIIGINNIEDLKQAERLV